MPTDPKLKNKTSYPGADPRLDPGRPLPPMQPAFHDDAALLPLVDALLPEVGLFVETGTGTGSTLLHVASRAPNIPCLSCEGHIPIARVAARNLWAQKNALIYQQLSAEFLAGLPPDLYKLQTLFFLDAHSHGFGNGCPLREEIAFILAHWRGGYIVADDFQVPGQPQFEYDVYPEAGPLCWEMIRPVVETSGNVSEIWYPQHKVASTKGMQIRGWILLRFGDAPPLDLPAAVAAMVFREGGQ